MSGLSELPSQVTVYEVGPRDGLQNEPTQISTQTKIQFVNLLAAAGLPVVEVTSFVQPGAIPQLADAEEVLAGVKRNDHTRFTALVPNQRGMERAAGSTLDGIALFAAASETFSRRNTNASIAETFERFVPVARAAKERGLFIRGYVSTAFGCPYEGTVPLDAVRRVCGDLLSLGVHEVVVSDTIGVATPRDVVEVVDAVAKVIGREQVALHFHDTRGTALANVLAGLQMGISTFDSSAGGLGGCPYAPGAAGNLPTEDLVYMLDGMGIETGVSLTGVVEASRFLSSVTGRVPASRYYAAAVA
jgi:isopropylmalate/homocitrate/citramalate synthase